MCLKEILWYGGILVVSYTVGAAIYNSTHTSPVPNPLGNLVGLK